MYDRKVLLVTAALWGLPALAQVPKAPAVRIPTEAPLAAPAAPNAAVAALLAKQRAQQAAEAAPPPAALKPSPEADEIAEINAHMAVESARLAELEIQSKIAETKAKIERSGAAVSPVAASAKADSKAESEVAAVQDSFIPSVSEISGIDHRIWAVLNVRGGTQTVRVGDEAAGWKVLAITPDSVTVKKGGRTLHLSFGNSTIDLTAGAGRSQGGPAVGPFGMPTEPLAMRGPAGTPPVVR